MQVHNDLQRFIAGAALKMKPNHVSTSSKVPATHTFIGMWEEQEKLRGQACTLGKTKVQRFALFYQITLWHKQVHEICSVVQHKIFACSVLDKKLGLSYTSHVFVQRLGFWYRFCSKTHIPAQHTVQQFPPPVHQWSSSSPIKPALAVSVHLWFPLFLHARSYSAAS